MKKPIEVGCWVRIINTNSVNDGVECMVLECVGADNLGYAYIYECMWRLDYLGPTVRGYMNDVIRESRLVRLDDPELKEKEEKVYILADGTTEVK